MQIQLTSLLFFAGGKLSIVITGSIQVSIINYKQTLYTVTSHFNHSTATAGPRMKWEKKNKQDFEPYEMKYV